MQHILSHLFLLQLFFGTLPQAHHYVVGFCQELYATGKRTARQGSEKESKFIMARQGENIRKRKDGRWEGRYIKVTSRTEPPFGAMSMGEPIQPRYRRVYHHHGRFVYFFCPSHQLKNRDSLLPRSSLFFCVFFQQRSRHLSGL